MASHDDLFLLLQSVDWVSKNCCDRSHLDFLRCRKVHVSVKPISEYLKVIPPSINLYGCSAIEILFLRGNGELITAVETPENELICKAHLEFLLLAWPNKEQVKRGKLKGKEIVRCSLSHETARAVTNKTTMRKDEVIEWLGKTGELVHVGAPICTTHRTSLQKGELKTTVPSKPSNPPRRKQGLNPIDEDFDIDEIALGRDEEVDSESDTDNDDVPSIDTSQETRDQISFHFSEIATLLGSNRYVTQTNWEDLSKDVKRRKISLVFAMVQMLCSLVAPGSGPELADTLSEKLSPRKTVGNDVCAKQITSAIGERLLDAPNRRTRIETLALIVDLPFFCATKVLTTIPTVTKHLIYKARMYNCGGINFDEKYTKVRFNEQAVDFFVSFVVRSNYVISLSWLNNYAKKSDGTSVEMGASVRLQSYARIDRDYRAHLRKYNKDKSWTLSYGSVYKLLSSIVPNKNRRLTCVDDFLVDALEGWSRLQPYVKDLGNMGHLTPKEECDLDRRIKLTKSYLESSFRSHIELSSNVAEHCAAFALSDPDKPAYRETCAHEHDHHCAECTEIDRVLVLLTAKVLAAKKQSDATSSSDRFELERMHGMTVKCTKYIKAYRAHVVRAVVSDTEKAQVQAALGDNEVLITCDWAQKILPQASIEPQSGYFAKAGMSAHITHIYAKIDGKYFHHSIIHVFESCKQLNSDVSCIIRHVFGILKTKGITKIILRSDNANCYKSSDLIGDLFHISSESPELTRYIYSEAQAGKGPCDRGASHVKRKIKEFTESRRNAKDATEVFAALTKNEPVKGTTTYLCEVGAGKDKGSKSQIPDISTLYDVKFEANGILARKHSGIGIGHRTPQSKLKPMNSTFSILASGGHLEENFWVELKSGSVADEEEEEKEPGLATVQKPRKDYVCSTPGCQKSFLKLRNLEIHEIVGNHKFKSKKQSMLDCAIDSFNHKIEVVEVAQEARANDSFVNSVLNEDPVESKMGWALKVNSTDKISDKAHKEAVDYFMAHRSMNPPRRADPRAFSQIMEKMKEPSGEYKFRAWELLTEKQLTGLFSRLETKRVSGVSVARKTRGRQVSKSSRKRRRPVSSEEEEEAAPIDDENVLNNHDEDDDDFRMDEEDQIWECIKEKYNGIFL